MRNKIHYKSKCGKLIDFNKDTNTYILRNTISKKDKRIPLDDFNSLEVIKIGHDEYCRLMNIYFNSIKDSWTYDGTEYQSLDNFEKKNYNFSSNYKLGTDVPYHNLNKDGNGYYYLKNLILVYHWGKVYYHTISYNGEDRGNLIDTKTLNAVQWCQLKNCSPVFNKKTKTIM